MDAGNDSEAFRILMALEIMISFQIYIRPYAKVRFVFYLLEKKNSITFSWKRRTSISQIGISVNAEQAYDF